MPIASISSDDILRETAALTCDGKGICVGTRFEGVEWKVIAISDQPLADTSKVEQLAGGEIGELIVTGPQVTRHYVAPLSANELHKIRDGTQVWHRMGDVGYLDERARFWFCGRKSHRVQTARGTMFTIPCEAILNQHPAVYRSALVGVGQPGAEIPYFVVEPWPEYWPTSWHHATLFRHELAELAATHPLTCDIPMAQIVLRRTLPVDVRHNAKIFREQLRDWVAAQTTEK